MKFPRQPVMPTSFNPRSRAASDLYFSGFPKSMDVGFNPRSRAASDASPLRKPPTMAGFQPTLARGERLEPHELYAAQGFPFQPTLARGERR